MKKIIYVLLYMTVVSCSSDDGIAEEFGKCDFSENTVIKKIKNKKGTLHYSKSISNEPLNSYSYYIIIEDELPLAICNMPSSFKMEEESEISVTFSGIMEVMGDRVDAISTRLELTKLQY